MNPNIVEISNQAENIARAYNPEGFSPFPHEKIQRDKKDLNIFFANFNDNNVSGVILYKEEKFNILVNSSKPKTRQYFTIAHELGHYFLHQDIIKSEETKAIIDGDNFLDGSHVFYRLDNGRRNEIETEANNFAASLIMPTELVIKAWNTVGSVDECAKIFQVSAVAMSIRLERLGLINN